VPSSRAKDCDSDIAPANLGGCGVSSHHPSGIHPG
jgi:hypothetical protein